MSGALVLGIESYSALAEAVCVAGGFERGDVERQRFPDGEHYQRLATDVADRDVALIGGTVSDHDTLELYDLACAAVAYGARRLTMVIPYFGYSTMERATRPGEVVTAKTRARLLSSVPHAPFGSRVVLVDLHAEGIPHYFEGDLHPVHLYAKPLVLDAIRELGGASFALGSTDAGRAKWVESLANDLGVSAGFVFKRRLDGQRTEVRALSADVRDIDVVLYDDMCRTGSSLLRASEAYLGAGARRVSVVVTHGVFPGESAQRIEKSGLLRALVCTDTHPRARQVEGSFVRVRSIAPLLAAFLAR